MLCNDLEGWVRGGGREAQDGGDICVHVADSHCCTTETNTKFILQLKIILQFYIEVYIHQLKINVLNVTFCFESFIEIICYLVYGTCIFIYANPW